MLALGSRKKPLKGGIEVQKATPQIADFRADLLPEVSNRRHTESQAQMQSPIGERDRAIGEQSPSNRQAIDKPSPSSYVANPHPLLKILTKVRI